jgi:di/tricarboxylate transporter
MFLHHIEFIFFREIIRSGIARSHGSSVFNFLGTSILFSITAPSFYIPANSVHTSFICLPVILFLVKAIRQEKETHGINTREKSKIIHV